MSSNRAKKLVPTTDLYVEPSVFFRYPLAQIIICPLVLLAVDVSLANPVGPINMFSLDALVQAFIEFWSHLPLPTLLAVKMIVIFFIFETLLLRFVPGRKHYGPVSPHGYTPEYVLNGVPCFLLTVTAFVVGSTEYGLGYYSMGIVHQNLGEIIITLTLSVKVIVFILYLKGVYAPSGKDCVVKKDDFWYNYFWGVELYPYIGRISLKQLVNCRLGMMSWPIIVISCCFSQQNTFGYISNSMLLSAFLQIVYVFKFYVWESGYLGSIDIMHDRFGYYLCWGCLCWIPGYYTSPGVWLAYHPITIPTWGCVLIVFFGLLGTLVNYLADLQRQEVRKHAGNCMVWGKKAEVVNVEYVTIDGKKRKSILLTSGWWGISRHFHYLPELLAAFCWCVPALDGGLMPYGYFFMLVVLLFDRQLRDEVRCSTKYGSGWKEYCHKVPYKIIPYLY
eukprot:TRINITY_DN1932_c0_g1_i2.p1 TRINITY_DN1932_c0_g1~~TRINITY_DN1932_c0_g1_i2.p1  ORF type:complete len:447 (-),score=43.18 TRINITY_DN1932_c0_g1_i2:109-1449(-)